VHDLFPAPAVPARRDHRRRNGVLIRRRSFGTGFLSAALGVATSPITQ
jgi:hypothetical protein